MTLAPGTKLGPYEILAPIGAGGMGEVWKARDTRLGRDVAIKKVKEQHSERFRQEARSIAALNHPYICQLHDIGEDYLVLEYVEGKPISSPLPEKEAVRLAIQIATALEAAHKKGIIHRDLKPANIMVTEEGSVKLLDFGLAKLYEQSASESTADFPATQAGAVLGTLAYMSPEQAQGQPADARSDIFSFGLVLYEMLSGKKAFAGENTPAVMAALLRDEPPPVQASPFLEKIVRRCLAKLPPERFQSMAEVLNALDQTSAKASEQQPSIAVLPFTDMSPGNDNEWFGDGLAEEIINALTQIPGLLVIARTSAFAFKGRQEDIRRIAEVLGATNILEGSVRKAGNRIRVTAQLIDAARGIHLWSQRYDRDMTDVFAMQDEIAAAIAAALEVKLSVGVAALRRYEPNPAAYEAYLKARYLWGKFRPELLAQAQKYLEQSVSLDPKFALAHCGFADHFIVLAGTGFMAAHEAMPKVDREARKALDIDPSLPEAHAMLGIVAGIYEYNWKEADRRFHLAMAIDPVPPRVRQWYGTFYLMPRGRWEEAVEQNEQGLKEDPLNLQARFALAASYLCVGRLEDAQKEARKVLELEENHLGACCIFALIYARQEKWTEALKAAEKAFPRAPQAIGLMAAMLKRMGEESRAAELVHQLTPDEAYGMPLGLSIYYWLSGEADQAMNWVKKAIEQRPPTIPFMARVLFQSSPQWSVLARLMNLPEEAR
jgi:eukaryotic-like serine/threonine-protein kinase